MAFDFLQSQQIHFLPICTSRENSLQQRGEKDRTALSGTYSMFLLDASVEVWQWKQRAAGRSAVRRRAKARLFMSSVQAGFGVNQSLFTTHASSLSEHMSLLFTARGFSREKPD